MSVSSNAAVHGRYGWPGVESSAHEHGTTTCDLRDDTRPCIANERLRLLTRASYRFVTTVVGNLKAAT